MQKRAQEHIGAAEEIAFLRAMLAERDAAIAERDERISALESSNRAISSAHESLSDDYVELEQSHAELVREHNHLKAQFDLVVEKLKSLNAEAFGAKSEKNVDEKVSLANEVEEAHDPDAAEPKIPDGRRKPRGKGRGRRWDHLPVTVVEHRIPEADRKCGECGTVTRELRVEVTRELKVVPAKIEIIEHRRWVYVCEPCSKANAADAVTPVQFKKAPVDPRPIERSMAHPTLIAYILVQKYMNALPLYRIEADLRLATGVAIGRQSMANWVIRCYDDWFAAIVGHMKGRLLENDILHIDETTCQVLKEKGRAPSRKSYMWVYAAPACADVPVCVFDYRETRARRNAEDFLGEWRGAAMTDGYTAYSGLENADNLACLVHIRRGFAKVIKAYRPGQLDEGRSVAATAVRMIDEVFEVERTFAGKSWEERTELRGSVTRGMLADIGAWLAEVEPTLEPKMQLHKATVYALKHWGNVMKAAEDGRYPLDNNLAERAIRPFAVGRKNFLFSDTPRGARASAGMYSVVTTAKMNGVRPFEYLAWVLTEMPKRASEMGDPAVLESFMPWSPDLPAECRMGAAEASRAAEMPDEPLLDVDPELLDEEFAG